MNNTAIIILAAGSSSRFGNIKQLLHFNNKTLLQHVIDEAIESGAENIVVVTGANADEVSKDIKDEKVTVVFNEQWEEGMASGIVAGLKKTITLTTILKKLSLLYVTNLL
jgi:molybdenum cofactor cytidylyltransferase